MTNQNNKKTARKFSSYPEVFIRVKIMLFLFIEFAVDQCNLQPLSTSVSVADEVWIPSHMLPHAHSSLVVRQFAYYK